MTTRTITAIYDSEADARAAREQLLMRGLEDDDVRIVSQNLTSQRASSDMQSADKGVWESIKDFFVGDDDRPVYSEGLRRGGYLLTARVDDTRSDEAIGLLEETNAVDLDERSQQWRSEGWSGEDDAYVQEQRQSGAVPEDESMPHRGAAVGEQTIQVAEERLRVGKREVDRGGVRVRSYVVEEPIHEEVSLREERVEIETRPASGRVRAGEDVFREQTIELSERGEEAVVSKDTVVTGEVAIRATADERIESVDDTVRRTEVDVDDSRKNVDKTRERTSKTSSSRDRRSK